MRQKNLLKISLCFTMVLFFYACTSRERGINRINKEIQVLRDSMAVETKKVLKIRLQNKARLEEALLVYQEPFKRKTALLNEKISSVEMEFRKNLKIAKDQHYFRFGHRASSLGSLNRIIDNLIY